MIKCKGLLKASRIVNLIASVVLGALAIASLVVLLVYGATLGIGFILNLVFIVGMIATTALTLAFARKK